METKNYSNEFNFKHECREHSKEKGYITGAIFILVGTILIANNFNLIPNLVADVLISWQMLLITIGTISIFVKKKLVGGLILIAVGSIFMLNKFLFFTVLQWKLIWPIALVFVGIVIILNVFKNKQRYGNL